MADSIEKRSGGRLSTVDKALVGAGVVGGVLVVLWIVRAVAHLVLFAFEIAILVIVVAVVVRLIHLFTRGSRNRS